MGREIRPDVGASTSTGACIEMVPLGQLPALQVLQMAIRGTPDVGRNGDHQTDTYAAVSSDDDTEPDADFPTTRQTQCPEELLETSLKE